MDLFTLGSNKSVAPICMLAAAAFNTCEACGHTCEARRHTPDSASDVLTFEVGEGSGQERRGGCMERQARWASGAATLSSGDAAAKLQCKVTACNGYSFGCHRFQQGKCCNQCPQGLANWIRRV